MKVSSRLTVSIILALTWTVLAQAPPKAGGGKVNKGAATAAKRGPVARNAFPSSFMQIRWFDSNGDLLIDEAEFKAGMGKMETNADKAMAVLKQAFDVDGDGKFSQGELRKVREFVWALMGLQPYDRNRDWMMSEEEWQGAWDKVGERCHQYNEFLIRRFDKNGDETLAPDEVAAAKEQLAKRGQRARPRRAKN